MASRVLIVEDEPDIRDLLAFHLGREGYQVWTAARAPMGFAWPFANGPTSSCWT